MRPSHLVGGQIDAVAEGILLDVAHDVDHLHGHPEILCVIDGHGIAEPEHVERQHTHRAGDAIAVPLERRPVGVAIDGQIHLHAIHKSVHGRAWDAESADGVGQRDEHGVIIRHVTVIDLGHLSAARCDGSHLGAQVVNPIHGVVAQATEGVEGVDATTTGAWQQDESEVEVAGLGTGDLGAAVVGLVHVHRTPRTAPTSTAPAMRARPDFPGAGRLAMVSNF